MTLRTEYKWRYEQNSNSRVVFPIQQFLFGTLNHTVILVRTAHSRCQMNDLHRYSNALFFSSETFFISYMKENGKRLSQCSATSNYLLHSICSRA